MQSGAQVDPRLRASALFNALARFAAALTPDQTDQILTGNAKITFVSTDLKVVDALPGLDQAVKLLKGLTDEDWENLENKTAKIVFQRPGQTLTAKAASTKTAPPPVDLEAVATEIGALPSEEAVVKFLDADRRLTGPVLRKLCGQINISIPKHVKTKGALQELIAEEVIGHRRRTLGY